MSKELKCINTTLTFISIWLFIMMFQGCLPPWTITVKQYEEPKPIVIKAPAWFTKADNYAKKILIGE